MGGICVIVSGFPLRGPFTWPFQDPSLPPPAAPRESTQRARGHPGPGALLSFGHLRPGLDLSGPQCPLRAHGGCGPLPESLDVQGESGLGLQWCCSPSSWVAPAL